MKRTSLRKLTLAVVGCAFLSTQAMAQSAEFAAPKRIKAGDKFMGQGGCTRHRCSMTSTATV